MSSIPEHKTVTLLVFWLIFSVTFTTQEHNNFTNIFLWEWTYLLINNKPVKQHADMWVMCCIILIVQH